MSIARGARTLLLTVVLMSAGLAATATHAAGAPTPTPSGQSTAASSAPAQTGLSASTSVGVGGPGTRLTAVGSGWPARATIFASTCGNLALNGAADCNPSGGGSVVTKPDGTFRLDMTVSKPPKPCPCVIHFVSSDTSATINQPFEVTGQPTAPLDRTVTVRTVTATARITGSGPLTAWFGGSAKRTFVLTVTNTGSNLITNPGLTLTIGKGSDPTTLLSTPQIGSVNAGQTVSYQVPVTLKAPALGQYRIKAYFSDLDKPVTATASTSTYPWALIVLGWLLLQPLLLGLYKRRPMLEADESEDPFAPLPSGPSPAPAPAYAGVAAATGAGVYASASPVYAAAGVALVPHTSYTLVPNYRPVFGVTDLRSYLDPAAQGPRPTVVPRIVVGGIVPRSAPVNGSAPPPTAP